MSYVESGWYWAYRKGSPVPDIVYVHLGRVYEIVHSIEAKMDGGDVEYLDLESEDLWEMKWRIAEKIQYNP